MCFITYSNVVECCQSILWHWQQCWDVPSQWRWNPVCGMLIRKGTMHVLNISVFDAGWTDLKSHAAASVIKNLVWLLEVDYLHFVLFELWNLYHHIFLLYNLVWEFMWRVSECCHVLTTPFQLSLCTGSVFRCTCISMYISVFWYVC